jgi:hypothetical protein
MSQPQNGNLRRRNIWIGIGLAAVGAVLFGHYVLEIPQGGENLSGTVAPAQRYRSDSQVKPTDVRLGDQSISQLLQNEDVDRLIKDPGFQALAANQSAMQGFAANASAFAALASNPAAFQAIAANASGFAALAQNPAAFQAIAANATAFSAFANNPAAFAAAANNPAAAQASHAAAFAVMSANAAAFKALSANSAAMSALRRIARCSRRWPPVTPPRSRRCRLTPLRCRPRRPTPRGVQRDGRQLRRVPGARFERQRALMLEPVRREAECDGVDVGNAGEFGRVLARRAVDGRLLGSFGRVCVGFVGGFRLRSGQEVIAASRGRPPQVGEGVAFGRCLPHRRRARR